MASVYNAFKMLKSNVYNKDSSIDYGTGASFAKYTIHVAYIYEQQNHMIPVAVAIHSHLLLIDVSYM